MTTTPRPSKRRGLHLTAVLGLTAAVALTPTLATADSGVSIDPGSVEIELAEGETHQDTFTVTVPEGTGVAAADVYLLMDTTGSMGPSINALRDRAEDVVDELIDGLPAVDLQFGVGDFKDFQSPSQTDAYGFNHAQSMTSDAEAVRAAIDDWSATGGGDAPEGHFYAYDQIAEDRSPSHDGSAAGTIGWRSDAKRILITFADVGGHDLVCQEITGQVDGHELDYDITEESATTKLAEAGITFVGISVPTGSGMDAESSGRDYDDACGESGASAGQATRMAEATDGAFLDDVGSEEIVDVLTDQILGAVGTINALELIPTGDAADFVTHIEPSSYGPLDATEDHELTFEVAWEGDTASEDEELSFTGSFEVRTDGSLATQAASTVTVPPTEAPVEGLGLSPNQEEGAIGDEHIVTATLVDGGGDAVEDAEVTITVTEGPHEGESITEQTDGDGQLALTYEGDDVGTDTIVATHTTETDEELTASATMDWSEVLPDSQEQEDEDDEDDEDDVEEVEEADPAEPVVDDPDYTG